jgi:hypothetical protein
MFSKENLQIFGFLETRWQIILDIVAGRSGFQGFEIEPAGSFFHNA